MEPILLDWGALSGCRQKGGGGGARYGQVYLNFVRYRLCNIEWSPSV